jgi:Leucine-rich repeat (LRR) protein
MNIRPVTRIPETPIAFVPLGSLTSLQTLDLSETQVADLLPLKSLASLQRLDLSGTRVADLSPLKSHIHDHRVHALPPLLASEL